MEHGVDDGLKIQEVAAGQGTLRQERPFQAAEQPDAEIIEEPHVNPAPQHREIWLRDPDGYVVVVASPDGECGS